MSAEDRINGDSGLTLPEDKIKCRTCRFAAPSLEKGGKVLVRGYKGAYCDVYDRDTGGKPNGILFRGEECAYYQRLEKRREDE